MEEKQLSVCGRNWGGIELNGELIKKISSSVLHFFLLPKSGFFVFGFDKRFIYSITWSLN